MVEHGGDESKHNTVFIDTNLDTRLVTTVSDSDTVYDLKRKIVLEHRQCFPAIGDINVRCLKVKRRGNLYHLTDSMLVKSAFGAPKKDWFVKVEASRLEQDGDIQHMDRRDAGNQLALPWVTNSQLVDRHDNHADRTFNLPLDCGSPSMHPIIAPFVNLKVPSTDQLTSGDSCKDVSKNIAEDRSANDDGWKNPKPDSEKQLDTKVQEELLTVNKEAKSKKRTRDVQNKSLLEDASGSGPSVKKRHKSQRLEGNVKASEEDIVSKFDTGELKLKAASIINESLCEPMLESKDLSDENTRGENSSAPDQVATSVPSIVEDVQEETHSRKNTEASETVPEVAMAVEKNMQQEMPFGISQMEIDTELVQQAAVDNEIPSSSMITGTDHLKAAECSTKPKAAEKEVSSTSFIQELHNINKDAMDSSHKDVGLTGQELAVDQIDKRKKDRGEGKKRKSKKSAVKSKDESLMKHADNLVGDISLTVPDRVFDEKSIDERKNDKDTFSSAERNEVSEKTLKDDSFGYAAKKGDDIFVKEVGISEPTESIEERSRKKSKTGGDRKTTEDVGRSSLRIDESFVKPTGDAEIVTNEEQLLPHSERKESVEIAYIDPLPVDRGRNDDIMMNNDVEVSRTENNASQVNAKGVNDNSEKQNENMDAGAKKNKMKKKAKKSAGRSDTAEVVANEEKLLPQTEGNENVEMLHADHVRNDNVLMNNDVELSKTEKNVSQVNVGGINDDLEKQNEKMNDGTKKKKEKKAKKSAGRSEDAAIVTTVEKRLPSPDIPKDNSNEIDFKHYFVPGHQPEKNALTDIEKDGKDVKLPGREKKTKKKAEGPSFVETSHDLQQSLVLRANKQTGELDDSRNDSAIQALLSLKKASEVSNDVVKDQNTRNPDEVKTRRTIKIDGIRATKTKASEVSNDVVKDQNTRNTDEVKTPRRMIKIDGFRPTNPVQASKGSNGPSPELLPSRKTSEVSNDVVKDQNTRNPDEVKPRRRTTKIDGIRATKTKTSEVSNNVIKDQNTRNTDEVKTPRRMIKIDGFRPTNPVQASEGSNGPSPELSSSRKTSEVSNDVVKDQNTRNPDEVKTPKRIIMIDGRGDTTTRTVIDPLTGTKTVTVVKHPKRTRIDGIRATKTVQASKGSRGPSPELSSMSESFGRSFPNKKSNQRQSTLGHSHPDTSKKSAPVVKTLLNTPGAIFGDDSDESSADDNATVDSDSSTRIPSRKSSSSEETDSDSSIDTRKNVVKRKDAYGKSTMNSQSNVKKSMSDLLRSSSRFKKARFSASQQVDDTESQPVDFVPESQL